MNPISGAPSQASDLPLVGEDSAILSPKRAVMTNDRLELVANTLMEPNNMRQFGIVLKTTPKGQAAQGSGPTFTSLRNHIPEKSSSKHSAFAPRRTTQKAFLPCPLSAARAVRSSPTLPEPRRPVRVQLLSSPARAAPPGPHFAPRLPCPGRTLRAPRTLGLHSHLRTVCFILVAQRLESPQAQI